MLPSSLTGEQDDGLDSDLDDSPPPDDGAGEETCQDIDLESPDTSAETFSEMAPAPAGFGQAAPLQLQLLIMVPAGGLFVIDTLLASLGPLLLTVRL